MLSNPALTFRFRTEHSAPVHGNERRRDKFICDTVGVVVWVNEAYKWAGPTSLRGLKILNKNSGVEFSRRLGYKRPLSPVNVLRFLSLVVKGGRSF